MPKPGDIGITNSVPMRVDADLTVEAPNVPIQTLIEVEGITLNKYPLPVAIAGWEEVEKAIVAHWLNFKDRTTPIPETLAEIYAEYNKTVPDSIKSIHQDYIAVHRLDYIRVMTGLCKPEVAERFWDAVLKERGYNHHDTDAYTARELAEFWNKGPDTFYLKTAIDALVKKVDGYDNKDSAYREVSNDLKILWSRDEFLRLLPGIKP